MRSASIGRDPQPRPIWWYLLLVSPGLLVLGVLVPSLALHMGGQLTPMLAAAPAIACAGTGRRMCILFGCSCALIALIPLAGADETLTDRLGTASAVLAVTFASYAVVRRRIRLQRAYAEVQQIAEVTQRVLLRPIPERIGPVVTAVEYMSAATGAHVGGDFYEVIDTPYGVRAILGDMRGNGLAAVSGAAALLGAFREAGAVEPTLEAVAVRLDAALVRHSTAAGRAELIARQQAGYQGGRETPQTRVNAGAGADGAGDGEVGFEVDIDLEVRGWLEDEAQVWAEDFATAVLVQVPYSRAWHASPVLCTKEIDLNGVTMGGVGNAGGAAAIAAGPGGRTRAGNNGSTGAEPWHGIGTNEVKLVNCGHPSPYLIRRGQTLEIEAERLTLPLGLGSLADEPYAVSSSTIPFGPGDALVFYTDGVSDARARSGEFFPLDGLLRDLGGSGDSGGQGIAPGLVGSGSSIATGRSTAVTPRTVAAAVRARLLEHMRGELDDDAALLVLGRLDGAGR